MLENQKSQQKKMPTPLAVLAHLLREFPVSWTPAELATVLGVSRRTAERACVYLHEAELLDKRRGAYTIASSLIQSIYGAKWFFKKEVEKDIKISKQTRVS